MPSDLMAIKVRSIWNHVEEMVSEIGKLNNYDQLLLFVGNLQPAIWRFHKTKEKITLRAVRFN